MNIPGWLMAKGSPREARRMLFVLFGVFAVSRGVYWLAGIRFAASWLFGDNMSIVPYDLLKTELFTSIWHFHAQPPLFSLFSGILVHLFDGSEAMVAHSSYLAAGAVMVYALYTLMTTLGAPFRIAAVVTALFTVGPAAVLYENLFLYTYPVTALLVVSALTLVRYLETGRRRWGAATCCLWAVIVLTRSLFHLVWFAAGVAVMLGMSPGRWRRTVLVAVVPFLLTTGWYAKNYAEFGVFGTSSWLGMNLSKAAMSVLSEEEKVDLVRSGEVSELVLLKPFPGLWQLLGYVEVPHAEVTGITVLDYRYTGTGFSNYNNMVYLSLSRQYVKDSLAILGNNPARYLSRSVIGAFRLFFAPADTWFSIWRQDRDYERNFNRIEPFIHVWNAVFEGDFSTVFDTVGWFALALYLSIAMYWPYRIIRMLPAWRTEPGVIGGGLFMLMTVVYIFLAGNLLELGENMRFRFNSDPFALTLFALMIGDSMRGLDARNASRTAGAGNRSGSPARSHRRRMSDMKKI